MPDPKKNVAFTFALCLRDASTGALRANATLAAGDVKISKDGGAFANLTTLPTVAPASGVQIEVALSQTEMNADRITIVFQDQTSPAEWDDYSISFSTTAVTVDDLVRSTTPANTLDVSATGEAGLDFDNVKAATAPTTLTNITVPTVTTVGTVTTLTGHTAQTGDSFARLGAPVGASISADIAAVKADTAAVKLKTDNLPSDPADESLIIAATDAITALLGAPAGASVSADIAAVKTQTAALEVDTQDIQSRLPAALVSGRIDASVGAMAAGTITAAAIATDAIDADALATDAVTEIATAVNGYDLLFLNGFLTTAGVDWQATIGITQTNQRVDVYAVDPTATCAVAVREHGALADLFTISATAVDADGRWDLSQNLPGFTADRVYTATFTIVISAVTYTFVAGIEVQG